MNTGAIATRYGKALLKYVQESGCGDKVYSQACVLVLRMKELTRLRTYVENHYEIPLEKKKEILDSALGETMDDALVRFITLVDENRRMEFFMRMLYSFICQYRKANGIMVGSLLTAKPVNGLKERLEALFHEKTGAEVFIEEKVDPEILGGFVFEMDGYMVDASVQEQFRRIKRQLIEKNNRIV